MMSEDLDQTAAAYALGIVRGAARAEIEAKLRSNPALRAKAELWQQNFAALDVIATQESPPAGLFDRILAAVEADEKGLPGTLTRRAGTGVWAEMAPGVTYTVLFDDPATKRRSMLIRALPGAAIESHPHEHGYEECLVLEGDLVIGDLTLYAGDYHVAVRGSSHPATRTISGCLCYHTTPL
jgi:anti-sigma factor ChrR (cupin superfamily)